MRSHLIVVLAVAACRPATPSSDPSVPQAEQQPELIAAQGADEGPRDGDASQTDSESVELVPPEVAAAVAQALNERYAPTSEDLLEAWTSNFMTWSVKTKRPVNDAALQALDQAYRAAQDEPARQGVVLATAQFYEGLAIEMAEYREQVAAAMSDPSMAPDIASTYWTQARQYFVACAGLTGPHADACQAGTTRAQAALSASAG